MAEEGYPSSLKAGAAPTMVGLALYFLDQALSDRLPKSPQGPKRFSAEGQPLVGLAPSTFLLYLPVLAHELFGPWLSEWGAAPAAGAEEKWMADFLNILDEGVPQGPGVLVIEAGEISRRTGLEEFVARVPGRLGQKLVLFGEGSVVAREAAARNGIAVVDSDRLSDLAFHLMLLGEEADRVGYLGNPLAAAALSKMLPASMELTPLDPGTALDKLLRSLGYSAAALEAINAAGMEELFAGARAA
jgi:hypothetical protein